MNIPHGVVIMDVRRIQLIDSVEVAAASLREIGEDAGAVALLRLRTKVREGLSFEEAKVIFDEHTKTIFGEKS